MKKKFGQFKIELGHGGQNGTPMRKWDTDGKMGHRWENGTIFFFLWMKILMFIKTHQRV
jgi:hypothetical protein